MKKMAILMMTGVAAMWLNVAAVGAQETQAAKIRRLQAEAKIAQLRAQAEAERVAAYEAAWRKTKSAAIGAACMTGSLYAGPLVGATCYGYNAFKR